LIKVTFYRAGYVVDLFQVIPFLNWKASRESNLLKKLKTIISLVRFVVPGSKNLNSISKLSNIESFCWLRYDSDGTKFQIFDSKKKQIVKISKKTNYLQLIEEVKAQSKMQNNTPKILSYDLKKGIIVEEWKDLYPTKVDENYLFAVYKLLKQDLYKLDTITIRDYLKEFEFINHKEELINLFVTNNLTFINITVVHGDLWVGNIFKDENNDLVLIDWEYSGIHIESYDVWFYFFQNQRFEINFLDENYYFKLAELLSKVYNKKISTFEAKLYNLVHLIERYRLFYNLKIKNKKEEMIYLKGLINHVTNINYI